MKGYYGTRPRPENEFDRAKLVTGNRLAKKERLKASKNARRLAETAQGSIAGPEMSRASRNTSGRV